MQSVTHPGAYVPMAYLSPVGNLHQVLVLGVCHTSASDAKQTSLQVCVCAQGACCLGSFEKICFLSGTVGTFCLPCMRCAPVHNFNFGSTGGEAVLNAPVVCFTVCCVVPRMDVRCICT